MISRIGKIGGFKLRTDLHQAALQHNYPEIEHLLEVEKVNPNALNEFDQTALHLAANHPKPDPKVIRLLAEYTDQSIRDQFSCTALQRYVYTRILWNNAHPDCARLIRMDEILSERTRKYFTINTKYIQFGWQNALLAYINPLKGQNRTDADPKSDGLEEALIQLQYAAKRGKIPWRGFVIGPLPGCFILPKWIEPDTWSIPTPSKATLKKVFKEEVMQKHDLHLPESITMNFCGEDLILDTRSSNCAPFWRPNYRIRREAVVALAREKLFGITKVDEDLDAS